MASFNKSRSLVLLLLAVLLATGCATRDHVADEYESVIAKYPTHASQTTIVILVDGLSQSMLKAARTEMPNLNSFFQTNSVAHTTFPSLTFPAIASLLKEKPPGETGLIGNSLYSKNKLLQFEKPFERRKFSGLMAGENVFSRLKAQGKRSVSLDYGLGADATSSAQLADFESMLTIAESDYDYADQKKIDSLYNLLSRFEPDEWPSFVFLHLIGVDFLAHENGPFAESTLAYIQSLDDKLETLFAFLKEKETEHKIVTLLTADHGFAEQLKYTFNLELVVSRVSKNIEVLNEGRMAAIFLHGNSGDVLASELLKYKGVQAIGIKTNGSFVLRTNSLSEESKYPFFLENLENYFAASNSPDLVVIPDAETVFSKNYVGYHGGPTAAETLVPLLTRNVTLTNGQAPALWNLLKQIVK